MARFALMFLVACISLLAQVGTDGSILGIVKDPTGASIPGAEIKVVNLETGLVQTARSDQDGNFQLLALPRGIYSVAASAPQFSTWELKSVELMVGETRRVSPVLKISDVKQEVVVEAGVELVQTERASVETAVEQHQIRELPLNGRDPVELVALVPGMRYLGAGGLANEHTVQGAGVRDDQTGFAIDGLDANDASNEKGTSIPNLDTVAQFSVQTGNFAAENGRNPVQVLMVTKGGTNEFHGTLWEFHRNAAIDARNTFATDIPKLIRNQYGFSLGGPILRNRTFFFISDEFLSIKRERIYNADTVADAMLVGDFSGRRTINDPLTGRPFPGNLIPADRISSASKFFFPRLLRANSPGNMFRAVASQPVDNTNLTLRVDQQLTQNQRAYVRWIRIGQGQRTAGYRPDISSGNDLTQHNIGMNYNWIATPNTLFTLVAGYLQSVTALTSADVGKENLTQMAGIQGFPTAGREESVGLPNVSFTGGYAGFSMPQQVPARFAREDMNAKASMSLIRKTHTIGFGYEYGDRRTLARHSSTSARGTFAFNGQYTGDGFADYLLGLLSSDERNFPLANFGMGHSPYSAAYLQDFWRVHPNISVTFGMRYDRWHEKAQVRNAGGTYLPKLGKIAAADDGRGNVDLTAQPVAPYLAAATQGLWITATEAGIPHGLFQATGIFSPRLGITWRPSGRDDTVLRGGYGIYTSSYNGNITGSQVISPPYWAQERQAFTRTSLQPWETAFPADPRAFITPAVAAAAWDVDPMVIHQFNLSLQRTIPWVRSAVTVSYVGNRSRDLITRHDYNEVPPGAYPNLQAARPNPRLSNVRLYENIGLSWYNSLQLKMERRMAQGLSYMVSYAFARNIEEFGSSITDGPTPFAPAGYDRGRSELERRHVMMLNAIWEVPVGRGRKLQSGLDPVWNGFLGGWQLSGTYGFSSGNPLTFIVPGDTLGNGYTPARNRPNLVGDPRLDNPGRDGWFNTRALAIPPLHLFGNAGLGLVDGPGNHMVNAALMKRFEFAEKKYLQLRLEGFNAVNHVNLANPVTTINQANTGLIRSAGEARQVQIGLKVIF